MSKVYNSKNFFVRNLPVLLAFLTPVVVLGVMFAFREIFPFGDRMYLRSDMYHQYVTFLKEFQSILKNGDSLLFTWNIGLGADLPAIYAYYLATPFYWLTVFLPSNYIPEIMSCLIILKAGLMSAAFAHYVQCRTGQRNFASAVFGAFYAMSSYMAAYSWNLMWLDCLVLLPLITLGLERLVKEKKVVLYSITLAVAILSNYYIAIMICIYLVLYFIYLIICEPGKGGFAGALRSIGRFAVYSVLAGLMAAITVIPAFVNLSSTASGNFSFPTKLRFYYNILEMLSRSIMNVEPTVLSGYIPNVYCTIGVFMLIPLFFICGKIRLRVKIGKVILIGIFLASFAMNIPTYIWHGFHYPNSLSSRQSFIYIFLILAMAYEVVIQVESFKYREIIWCLTAGIGAIFALQVLYDSEEYTINLVLISVCFLALYGIWMILKKSGRIPQALMIIILLAIAVSEAAINTNATGYSTTGRSAYMDDNEPISRLLEGIGDDGFYRVEKIKRRTKNDGAWLNYRSASEFSSTTIEGISDFYDYFGMQSSTNSFSYYGHTPFSAALLGIKYEIAAEEQDDPLMTLVGREGDYYLYENKYSLPLGFMTDVSVSAETNMHESSPFLVQNSFINAACGGGKLFSSEKTLSGTEIKWNAKDDGRQLVYITDKISDARAKIERGGEVILDKEFSGLENPQIIDLGDVENGDKITIESADEDKSHIKLFHSIMKYERLEEVMETMGRYGYQISEFSDTYIKGKIIAIEEGIMFTTIPYYKGWEAYVDGEKVETRSFYKAFVIVPLKAGEHVVEFKYRSTGLELAALISAVTILIFLFSRLIHASRYPKTRKSSEKAEKIKNNT
ncbi:MAG: YfhO family protein [Lachnospiraceae bacterium]|jgi:uncharacterized membrane protein YfhO